MGRIFVSIASYRDPLLATTIKDALENAAYPDRIVFGVVDQSYSNEKYEVPIELRSQVRYVGIDPGDARGACWARSLCMSLYSGEEWFLQIDAHTLFSPGWDSYMVENLALCYQRSNKPVLTGFPNAFNMVNGVPKRLGRNNSIITTVVHPDGFYQNDTHCLHIRSITADSHTPIRAFHAVGGYIFTSGRIVSEIPYDPNFYFEGEESGYSLRLYTHGWDVFHAANSPLFHLYDTADSYIGGEQIRRMRHRNDDTVRAEKWQVLDTRSKGRLGQLINGKDLGIYSLGVYRTLAEYTDFCGVDYVNKVIHPKAYGPMEGVAYKPKEAT